MIHEALGGWKLVRSGEGPMRMQMGGRTLGSAEMSFLLQEGVDQGEEKCPKPACGKGPSLPGEELKMGLRGSLG